MSALPAAFSVKGSTVHQVLAYVKAVEATGRMAALAAATCVAQGRRLFLLRLALRVARVWNGAMPLARMRAQAS